MSPDWNGRDRPRPERSALTLPNLGACEPARVSSQLAELERGPTPPDGGPSRPSESRLSGHSGLASCSTAFHPSRVTLYDLATADWAFHPEAATVGARPRPRLSPAPPPMLAGSAPTLAGPAPDSRRLRPCASRSRIPSAAGGAVLLLMWWRASPPEARS